MRHLLSQARLFHDVSASRPTAAILLLDHRLLLRFTKPPLVDYWHPNDITRKAALVLNNCRTP